MARSANVHIHLRNQHADVANLSPDVIDDILGCERRVFTQAADGTITSHLRRVRPWEPLDEGSHFPLYTKDDDSTFRTPRGLADPRLLIGLNDRNIAYKVTRGPITPTRELGTKPAAIASLQAPAYKRKRLKAIIRQGTAWIEYNKVKDRVWLMARIIEYYSAANVLIVAKNDKAAKTLAEQLEAELNMPISVGGQVIMQDNGRIHISTSSPWFDANVDLWQVVLFDGIAAATNESTFYTLLNLDHTLRFGFAQTNELLKVDDYRWLRAEALCGPRVQWLRNPVEQPPIIQMMAEHGGKDAERGQNNGQQRRSHSGVQGTRTVNKARKATKPDRTATMTVNQGHNPKHGLKNTNNNRQIAIKKLATKKRTGRRGRLCIREGTDERNVLERKRTEIWKNKALNRRIADAARAVCSRNESMLKKMGCKGLCKPLRGLETDRKPRVAIFVESAEHARELHKALPKWMLLQRQWSNIEKQDTDTGKPNARRKKKMHQHVIVTETYVAHKYLDVDVVIVASGSVGGLLRVRKAGEKAAGTCNGLSTRLIVNVAEKTP